MRKVLFMRSLLMRVRGSTLEAGLKDPGEARCERMKWTRAHDVGRRRSPRVDALGVVLCVSVMILTLLACRDRDAQPALAPQHLFDADEIAAYLDAFPKGDYQIAEVPGLGSFYIDDNPATVKKTLLAGKPWAPGATQELEKHLARGDTALDIGAHIGSLTVVMAREVGREGTVYAFEPQRKIYRELVHNLELNELPNVVPLRFALSESAGIIEMDPAVAHDGRVGVGKGGDEVEARTIDSFGFSQVSLMKIDVEGHEVEVLRGAEKTIRALHPVILVEVRGDTREVVAQILKGHGYAIRKISFGDYIAIYEPRP
jgi:FkbM family methyltransferase